jgi:hypothetical protein
VLAASHAAPATSTARLADGTVEQYTAGNRRACWGLPHEQRPYAYYAARCDMLHDTTVNMYRAYDRINHTMCNTCHYT